MSAWLAVVFGAALSVLEVLRNWPTWQWWPYWLVDYIAAALLVAGGILALRRRGEKWLTAGWAFACAMLWASYFTKLEQALEATATLSARDERLMNIIGAMFLITIVGLVLSLAGRPKTP
ncbi:hypothetical protein [Phenylobacterium sp.]|uniref:hypothetical protein n=1 Tax=Phenylobacterium sp. TaxID=1871053 RepID=UPI002811FA4F|nr:hypothetical protein [Phenylobacterium sp.]